MALSDDSGSAGGEPGSAGGEPGSAGGEPASPAPGSPPPSADQEPRTTRRTVAAGKRPAPRRAASKPAAAKAAGKEKPKSTAKGGGKRDKQAAKHELRIEAAADRLRALNERIIDAGREAGETTLASYEKALKTIATGLEKSAGRSDVDWVASVAVAQAKFIRDMTEAWVKAARELLK